MRKLIYLTAIFLTSVFFAQNVFLHKVLKSNSNSEKVFYKIDPAKIQADYLGEIEVQGYSEDDVKTFGLIYKKAKEIGANAFSYKPFETIDGVDAKFNYANYKLSLYFVESKNFPKEENVIYLIASPLKKQKISLNKQDIDFEPRTFIKKNLPLGEIYTVSTKKLFGATIQLSGQEDQDVQYFQFSAFSINSNPYGSAGINLKSGDITRLEQSYGQFLTMIYQEVK